MNASAITIVALVVAMFVIGITTLTVGARTNDLRNEIREMRVELVERYDFDIAMHDGYKAACARIYELEKRQQKLNASTP